ncbi:GNAT family N-acetyltransferase [Paenibacillus faecis]|uniref:GNAT family N-acetyltransferase n=1 Tax=Paenibacillus faecis TaxID=862114 RepID=A0A5D0CUU4_9BACL|nr:GNAT family N-acetyltransferase [Paenibacillus faecis]TYA13440.1 GNAT family N-acetyltransferase [Paenibacillus faecis]
MLMTWEDRFIPGVIELWNREAVRDGYKELTEQSFRGIFTDSRYFDPEAAWVMLDQRGTVRGFACGCTGDDLPLGETAGYLTCIVLDDEFQTEENYRGLLAALERRFRSLGKKQAEVLFFNPMQLPWYIPDTPRHEHNNAPGVPAGSGLHGFLLREGYAERAQECGMYLPLGEFAIPEDIRAKERKAAEAGYRVELYDPRRHDGLAEMLDGFDNPLWKRQIPEYAEAGEPLVIAALNGKAAGFAGPVVRQENGRGFFVGIGVHSAHEGHGLGSVLFFKLCEAFQQIGTDYMSLFTGMTNPAMRIYEKAGFRKVKTFAVMRREF